MPSIPGVSFSVSASFAFPELRVGGWLDSPVAAVVHVPEATMNKNHLLQAWKDQIRFPWQVLLMQPVAISHCMDQAPHHHLGLGVLAPDAGHAALPLLRR